MTPLRDYSPILLFMCIFASISQLLYTIHFLLLQKKLFFWHSVTKCLKPPYVKMRKPNKLRLPYHCDSILYFEPLFKIVDQTNFFSNPPPLTPGKILPLMLLNSSYNYGTMLVTVLENGRLLRLSNKNNMYE